MSIETMEALESGEISPAQFWIRHLSAWTLIADTTPLPEVEDTYRDLADVAGTLAEAAVRFDQIPAEICLN
jgi:hypothetical protein